MGRAMRGGSQAEAEIDPPYWGGIYCTSPCNVDNKYIKRIIYFNDDDLKNAKYLWEAGKNTYGGKRITIPVKGKDTTYTIRPDYTFSDSDILGERHYTKTNPPKASDMVDIIKLRHRDDDFIIINAKNEAEAVKLLTEAVQK
jgi:hypothetical protein